MRDEKRTYSTPELTIHGDVTAVTQSVSVTDALDGAPLSDPHHHVSPP